MKLGLDISTSCVGYCILDYENKIKVIGHIDLNKKINIYEKAKYFKYFIGFVCDKNYVEKVNIEEPMMMFMGGKSRAQTIALLQKFNGMVSYIMNEKYDGKIKHYNVRSARKNLGFTDRKCDKAIPVKQRVYEYCLLTEPSLKKYEIRNKNDKLKDEFFDMIDAYVIAKQGD